MNKHNLDVVHSSSSSASSMKFGTPPTESMFCFSKVFSKVEQEERDRVEAANEQARIEKEQRYQASNDNSGDGSGKESSHPTPSSTQKAIQSKGFYNKANKLKKTSPKLAKKKFSSKADVSSDEAKFTLQNITDR